MCDLPEYNQAIRLAFRACQKVFLHSPPWLSTVVAFREKDHADDGTTITDAHTAAADVVVAAAAAAPRTPQPIPRIHQHDITPEWFLKEYIQSNRPCLIICCDRGTDSYFARAATIWHSPTSTREWFRRYSFLTDSSSIEVVVPVRRQPEENITLDLEGRAKECETVMMSLQDWIAYLDRNNSFLTARTKHNSLLYLKDWHLQSILERQYPQQQQEEEEESMYIVPTIFPKDMLNPFLKEFDLGDYRFVYWGPSGSSTPWHSDVMNSYSWSYNVYGEKQWTMEGWETCIQQPGELLFVPSKLKHCVTNISEALSINHNWITVWNVADVWDCMVRDIKAIDLELESWHIIDAFDAKENMLRGCLGMDVTAFVFMILLFQCKSADESQKLKSLLLKIMDDDLTVPIGLRERLASNLMDAQMADETLEMARKFVEW